MGAVEAAERLNLSRSRLANVGVYDNSDFPWTSELESGWRSIRSELDGLLLRQDELPAFHEMTPDVATITTDRRWKTFPFAAYGMRSRANIERCPETWRLLQVIPGLETAMFSILEPGKHLPPHRGPYNGVLRLHLGLMVPEPREACAIRVGERTVHWREGEAMVFDDGFEHEAWNRSSGTRVVLFVDFRRPLRFPANLTNAAILSVARFTPFLREGGTNMRRWEKTFYGA